MALTEVTSKGIKDATIATGDIANDAVDQTKIADNAVGLDQLAGIARGKIIYGDCSGTPAVLTVGTDGQVIKSDGTDISWGDAAAGATGGGTDKVFWVNENSIDSNYTIPDDHNAGTFGPVTIADGVTVEIGAEETWTII